MVLCQKLSKKSYLNMQRNEGMTHDIYPDFAIMESNCFGLAEVIYMYGEI